LAKVLKDILQGFGNTPVVQLNKVARGVRPKIFAKLEMMNPGGSVKDRIATYIVEDAEKKGLIKRGSTIIEPTSGNTGVGLAQLAAVKGYKVVFTMPDKVSEEKRALLRAYGAKLVIAPTDLPPDSPKHYVNVAKKLRRETKNSFLPNQYENEGNPRAHYATTGPEIWEQMGGQLDAFVAGIGTGGTISGVGRYLKRKNKRIVIVGVEPEGSMYYNERYEADFPLHAYKVEGIGEDFLPRTYDSKIPDVILRITDQESFAMTRRLAREEGILAGGSSGTAVAGCLKFARAHPGAKKIVVLLPDTGRNYLSKIFNDEWMKSQGYRFR
jgi:cystathionine beta-synthase